MKEKEYLITCPKCGREYLPAEIFYPEDFLGNPKNITRDEDEHIIYYEGLSMWPKETYTCDSCGTKFEVDCALKFMTKSVVDIFDEEGYTTKIKKEK